ncbi:hypothetical protein T07_5920, partial [Trichinella nelsoni]
MFTSVCSKCGITKIRNWIRKALAHFIHDSITLTSSEFDTTLRQSSSAGARIDLSSLWIMSSHEARTDANKCLPGVSVAFTSRPSVPLLITNSKKEFDIMTAMEYSQLMALANCVSYGSDCVTVKTRVKTRREDLNDLHRITDHKVLVLDKVMQ